jgi:NitT/TauT family transport system substrate-binding protein
MGRVGLIRGGVCAFVASVLGVAWSVGDAMADDRVVLGINGPARAEHGGFYQAVADGTYHRYGLDVVLREATPEDDNVALLLDGQLNFAIAGTMLGQLEQSFAGLSTITIAAFFQKEALVLLAHPDVTSLDQLAGKTLLLSGDGRRTFWPWLKLAYGLSDAQVKPLDFEFRAFVADPLSVQEGYVSSASDAVESVGGFTPSVLTMGEASYRPYASLIQTTHATVTGRRELVQRFVDATIAGWYVYLYGDPAPAHALIRQHRPNTTDAALLLIRHKINSQGLVDSGMALRVGIGAMDGGRWIDLFKLGHRREYYRIDQAHQLFDLLSRMYTLDFVNQKSAMEIKHRLLAD